MTLQRTAFITGASRGVGARVALFLARQNCDIALNFRAKTARAKHMAGQIEDLGQRAILVRADLLDRSAMREALQTANDALGELNILILNASGGLEKNVTPDYPFLINHHAQTQTLDLALPLLSKNARVVFVTSHLAHFWGEKSVPAVYEAIAASKKSGESALLARQSELDQRGISLVIASADTLRNTTAPRILARRARGQVGDDWRDPDRTLPSVDEFAHAIVNAALNPKMRSGEVVLVGSEDKQNQTPVN